MTFYDRLNQAIDYLEGHLKDEVDYHMVAQIAGVSLSALQRLFPLLAGVSISEYLRKRRLTAAGRALAQGEARIIDVALDYGYDSATAFSRAFTKFHGIKPSLARKQTTQLKYYPKLVFRAQDFSPELTYEIVELPAMTIYGLGVATDEAHIRYDAPQLFRDVERERPELGFPDYGMVSYNESRFADNGYEYWVLWSEPAPGLKARQVPASRWLKFRINCQEAPAIQAMSDLFYLQFLTTCEYELSPEPELEFYHDGVTDLLIPIR